VGGARGAKTKCIGGSFRFAGRVVCSKKRGAGDDMGVRERTKKRIKPKSSPERGQNIERNARPDLQQSGWGEMGGRLRGG